MAASAAALTFACSLPVPAFAVLDGVTAERPFDACPHIWEFERGGDSEFYALVLRAKTAMTVDATLRVYLGGKSYTLALPATAIDTPGGTQTVAYRSVPIVVRSPDTSFEPSAIVAFGGDAAGCPSEALDVSHGKALRYEPVEPFKKLESAILREADAGGVRGLPEDDAPRPPACAKPHVDAAADKPASPEYPEIARQSGDVGTVIAIVSLDSRGTVRGVETYATNASGSLERATLDAANRSGYRPQTSACVPTAGTYFFRADFQIGR